MKHRGNIAYTLLLASCLLMSVASVRGAALIHEPFDYSAGGLSGKGGSTEVGLDGTWTANASAVLTSDTLTHGVLPASGNKVGPTSGGSNNFGGARTISASTLAANGLLDDGAVLWFSLIMGYGPGGNRTNTRLVFVLADESMNNGNFNYWLDTPGATGLGVTMGRFSGVNGKIVATLVRDQAFGDGFAGNVFGNSDEPAVYPSSSANMDTALIVGKITWGTNAVDPDVIELFVPDTDLLLPASANSTLSSNINQSGYDTITWARGDKVVIDEVRFGATFNDVVPVASGPPTTATLSPTNEATNVSKSADLVATFNKPVQLTGSGSVTITNITDGGAEVISLPDSRVTMAEDYILTVDKTNRLANGKHYAVLISGDAVLSYTNPTAQAFAGISDPDEWDFVTSGDGTPPTLQDSDPADDSVGAGLYGTLTASFSEDMVLTGEGSITLRNVTAASDDLVITLPNSSVSVSGSNMTINPSIDLNTSMVYAVQISADSVEDLAGNLFAGTVDETNWNFTTVDTPHFVWTGAVDGDWDNTGNWNANGVPVDNNPASSALTFPKDGTKQRIRFAAYGSSNEVPTANIPTLGGGWSGGEFDTPSIDLLHGGSLNLQRSGEYWSGAQVTFLTVGDGDVENGTNTVNVNGVTQLNRQCSGTQRWIVNADGALNFTRSGNLSFAYSDSRAAIVTLAGGTVTVNGGLTSLASTQAGTRPSYVEFTMPDGALTAKWGGEFANLVAVEAEIGDSKSFRIGSSGLDNDVYIDVSTNAATFTLTLIDPPAKGTVLIIR